MPTVRVYADKSWEVNPVYTETQWGSFILCSWDINESDMIPINKGKSKAVSPASKINSVDMGSINIDRIPRFFATEVKGDGMLSFSLDAVPQLAGAYITNHLLNSISAYVRKYDFALTLDNVEPDWGYIAPNKHTISWEQKKQSHHGQIESALNKYGKIDFLFASDWLNNSGKENENEFSKFFRVRLFAGWDAYNDDDDNFYLKRSVGQSGYTIDGASGEHPPYIDIEYELLTPTFTNLLGVSNFSDRVDASKPITFAWTFGYNNHLSENITIKPYQVVHGYKQASARLRTRVKGETAYTEYKIEGEGNQISLDLSTLTATEMEYQLIVTSNGGVSSKDESWHPFKVINPYIEVKNLSPKGQIINGEIANVFSWENAHIPLGEQAAYEAQVSADNGGTWQALSSGNQALSRFTLAARRLEPGTYRWRVRCKNKANIWGKWSEEATFLVQRGLTPPTITSVSSTPRPTVTWTSVGQKAWQMQITDAAGKVLYDSGTVYGGSQRFKVPVFLPDGAAQVSVRAANLFGAWSPWGRKSVVIQNQKGPAITIKTRKVPLGAQLEWEAKGQYTRYYIYRDGVPVARCTRSPYTDYRANGKHAYFIRGVDSRDNYTDSQTAYEITLVDQAAIADYETLEWIRLDSKRGGAPTHDTEREVLTNFVHYDGRRLPVAEVSEFSDVSHEFSFTLYDRKEEARLHALLGKTVIYKNCFGDTVVGMLYRDSTSRDWSVDATFSIVETDCREAVDFD